MRAFPSEAAFPQFRKMLENEMDVWFRARGLLLIGEPIENVEAILKEEIGADAEGDGMLS